MANLNPFLARFDNNASLIAPEMQGFFESCLHQTAGIMSRLDADQTKPSMLNGDDDFWYADDDWRAVYRPYNVRDGILQIPVKGVLLHDFPYQLGGWATGYEYIWQAVKRGQADANVKGFAMICDTPGGMVAGCFEAAEKIEKIDNRKPMRGYAMESAYSAGYAMICVTDSITVSRTGGVGSIGVVTAHVDVSKMMEDWGYKVTFIHAGKHKVDGNPYEALDPEVKERIQVRINELYDVFVAHVARNRGMDEKAIRDTEALTFTATQAKSNGLADDIGSLEDAIAAFAVELSLTEEDENMADFTQAQYDEGTAAARTEGLSAGKAEGVKEGAAAERTRVSAIVSSEEGKKRPAMALKMATGDKFASLDADTVIEMLADMPEEKATTTTAPKTRAENGKSQFETAMDNGKNPDLGTPADEEQANQPSRAERAAAAAFGSTRKTA